MMKRVFATSLIAMFVSTGVLAQQATEEIENSAQELTVEAENTLENAANETEAAADELAQDADAMAQDAENAVENAAAETEAATEELAQDAESAVTPDAEMASDRPMLRSPTNISREGYQTMEQEELTADALEEAEVYGANDEEIGEVEELLLSEDGSMIEQVVIEVGGFLGMGEHEVAVTMEELHIMRSDDGDEFRVYIDATEEELEAQPEYEG